MEKVAVAACTSYDPQEVLHALEEAIVPIGGLDFVKPGMRVAVKVNLITAMRPQAAGNDPSGRCGGHGTAAFPARSERCHRR